MCKIFGQKCTKYVELLGKGSNTVWRIFPKEFCLNIWRNRGYPLGRVEKAKMLEILLPIVFSMVYDVLKLRDFFCRIFFSMGGIRPKI